MYTASLNSIKLSEYKIGIKFDKDRLAVEQNNYLAKIVNIYIFYDLDTLQKISLKNFTLKSFLFGVTDIVKIGIKKNMYIVTME